MENPNDRGAGTNWKSIPAVTTVQTACLAEADRMRQAQIASDAKPEAINERAEALARIRRRSACNSISLLLASIPPTRNLSRKPIEFPLVKQPVIHHPEQEFLNGSTAQAINNLPHRLPSHALGRLQALINVCAAFHAV